MDKREREELDAHITGQYEDDENVIMGKFAVAMEFTDDLNGEDIATEMANYLSEKYGTVVVEFLDYI